MFQRAQQSAYATLALLASGMAPIHAGPTNAPETIEAPRPWNRPIAFTLEARTVERDAAFGVHVVHPIFHDRTSAVLVEGYGFEGEEALGLAGGGVVYRRASDRRAFETNVFFDGLRTTDGFSYPQLGAGIAFSPDRWVTLRANGYLPLRGKDSRHWETERWDENEGSRGDRREVYYSRERRIERAPMRGFDVEAEFRLPEPPRWIDPRLAVGFAFRDAEDRPEVFSGPLVRGEVHFAKHWVAEGECRQDMHGVEQEWRVGVRFEILLGAPMETEGARGDERFLPAQRFPWPTVARGVSQNGVKRGGWRALAPTRAPQAATPDDCCPSGNGPLIFE